MKRKIIKSLFAVVCLLCSTSVLAYDFEVDGIYYNVMSLSGLTCEVTSGNSKYTGNVVIPATVNYSNRTLTVVGIAYKAFYGCIGLTSVTTGNSVTSIGIYAFYSCDVLATLKLGSELETIGDNAFFGCNALTELIISDKVKYIGNEAFSGCRSLITLVSQIEDPFVIWREVFRNISANATLYVPRVLGRNIWQ